MISIQYRVLDDEGQFDEIEVRPSTCRTFITIEQDDDAIHLQPYNVDDLIAALQAMQKEMV